MKFKWQVPAMAILLLVAGCSKDEEVETGELIIEDFMNQARESKMGPNFTIDLEEQS